MLSLIALSSLVSLLAVWIGYPIAIATLAALLGRTRKGAASVVANEPTVSVIIASRDDVEATRRRIEDCLHTSYDHAKLEIVVAIDRRATGVTERHFESIADRVTVVIGDEPGGKAATLNAAARVCRGEILVFGDVHQRFHPDAIGGLVAALGAPRVGAVSGCLDIPKTRTRRSLAERYWLFERWLRRREADVHSAVGVTGAIWALRTSLWSPLPPQLILDDLYAPMQVALRGYQVGFAQAARAIETRRHAPAQEYRRKVRTLTGVIQVCAWLPQVLIPIRNPIWLQFIVHKILRLLTPYWLAAIGLWAAAMVTRAFAWSWSVAIAVAAIAAIALSYARSHLGRVVWDTVVSGALLQAAAVVGTVNGLRGRWNVWGATVPLNEEK